MDDWNSQEIPLDGWYCGISGKILPQFYIDSLNVDCLNVVCYFVNNGEIQSFS